MGHGHHEPFKIPHYSTFNKWEQIPLLVEHNKRLERIGLSDPWIRNLVHIYDAKTNIGKSQWRHFFELFRPGVVPGLIIAGSVIALEEGYSLLKHGKTSWADAH